MRGRACLWFGKKRGLSRFALDTRLGCGYSSANREGVRLGKTSLARRSRFDDLSPNAGYAPMVQTLLARVARPGPGGPLGFRERDGHNNGPEGLGRVT